MALLGRLGIRLTQGARTLASRLLGSSGSAGGNPYPIRVQLSHGSRPFSSYSRKGMDAAKSWWNDLDPRAQGVVYDTLGKCVVVLVSGAVGLQYMGPSGERLDRMEEKQAKINKEHEAAVFELKVQMYRTSESVSKSQEEMNFNHQKLVSEMRELKYMKDLWMATAFRESYKVADKD